MADPEIKTFGDSVVAVWGPAKIVCEFSRLSEHKDALSAELSVTNERGALHWSRVNLASASGRHAVVKALEEGHPDLPWRTMLDRACQLVARNLRAGEPAVGLVPTPPAPDQWLIAPWIPLGETTVLYGTGGSAKSLLALTIALGGILGHTLGGPWGIGNIKRALYLDWESTQQTHQARMWGLTHAIEMPPPDSVLYRRLRRPLVDSISDLRAEAARHEIEFVILDSLAPASGPEPETAGAAVPTLQALDSLPGTKLALAHVSKVSSEQPRSKPFGSVMVENLARSTIEVRRQEAMASEPETTVSLYHRKANNGPLAPATALTYRFHDTGGITITRAMPETKGAGLGDQILDALSQGGQRVTDLAETLGSDAATVRTTLNRLETRNKVVKLVTQSGGKGKDALWGRADTTRNSHERNA